MRSRLFASLTAAVACLLGTGACVSLGTDADARFTIANPPPSGADFKPVGLFLIHRCGSLDCHGQIARNLRLYGLYGLRLDPMGVPSGGPTTADELDADYRSVVALEPELMNEVVANGGANPTMLTFYRKPTGIEHHKGGTIIQAGDDQDVCITSWLASQVDKTACANAANAAMYP